MIPVKLQLHNFLSYKRSETVDFSGFDLAILSGNNGVGKSSLLEAITWAVWGKSRAATDDNLIYQGESTMWVEYIFDYEESRYRIFRSRDTRVRGSSSLEFQVAEKGSSQQALTGEFARHWKPITGATIRNTQEAISKALKLDYDLFVNSSYLRQGHADEFTTKIPGERKEILAQILDLSLYDRLEEKAKEQRRMLELSTELLTAQITDLAERTSGRESIAKDLGIAQKEKERLQKEVDEKDQKLKSLEKTRRQFETTNKERDLLRSRYEELSKEITSTQKEIAAEKITLETTQTLLKDKEKIDQLFKKLQQLRKEDERLRALAEQTTKIEQELNVMNHEEERLQQTIAQLNHITVCPTCLRTMSKKEAEKIIKNLTDDFTKTYGEKLQSLQKSLNKIAYTPKVHAAVRTSIMELETIEEDKRKVDIAESAVSHSQKLIQLMEDRLTASKKRLMEVVVRGKSLNAEMAKLEKSQSEWDALESAKRSLQQDLDEVQVRYGGLQDRLKQIGEQEKERKQKEEELKHKLDDVGVYQELANSFGKKGVQAMIIEKAIPQIEEGANHLLQKITSGRMQVKLVTQRAKKNTFDEVIETLEIDISDELGTRPYEQYSGGEAFRINFAIRVALAKLLAMRAGAKLKFLAIDEGFGSLDSSGRDDIVAAISGIREEFAKIIIVTHIDEFKSLFPTRVEVIKDATGSHVQVINQ